MTVTISPEKMEQYRRTARRREAEQRQAMVQRREVAWTVARRAASLLKEQFGATQVVVYGSLAHGAWFNARSDIDLMVVGIPPDKFWRAWAELDQVSGGFEIELVTETELTESLRKMIQREGVEL
jgi:predicted nucleotidyltransferase